MSRCICRRQDDGLRTSMILLGTLLFHSFSVKAASFLLHQHSRHQCSTTHTLARNKLNTHHYATPKEDGGGDGEGDGDFSSWIQGLSQWPLRPGMDDDPVKKSARNDDSFQENNPVTSLLNMEALFTLVQSNNASMVEVESLLSSVSKSLDALISIEAILAAGATVTNITSLEQISNWNLWVDGLKNGISDLTGGRGDQQPLSAEGVFKLATAQIDGLIFQVAEASAALSPKTIQDFVVKASEVLKSTTKTASLVEAVKDSAVERGLDAEEAADRAQETIEFSTNFVRVADGVMRKGYVPGDPIPQKEYLPKSFPSIKGSRALFADFKSATEINEMSASIAKVAEMGVLAGAIYEQTIPKLQSLEHTLVATGMTKDVKWMVSDSIASESSFMDSDMVSGSSKPFLQRTITIRGFDASDGSVADRERLLNVVINASPAYIPACKDLAFHSGLLGIARAIYQDIKQYVAWTAPSHKIVLNGHSIGGSLSQLVLFLMTLDMGEEFVRDKVLRVFTFGSPPVVRLRKGKAARTTENKGKDYCQVLDTLDLPSTMVEGYVQPWDPIVRLFTEFDPLYPLLDDIGDDGVTVFAGGPPRTLRPITKAIFEAWDGWPQFRDTFRGNATQRYSSVGIQHILIPEPTRYLADRFVAVNIPEPPIETVLRIAPAELLPALVAAFPLDVFEISFVPQAVRSFVHHFFPAYGSPIVEYVKRLERRRKVDPKSVVADLHLSTVPVPSSEAKNGKKQAGGSSSFGWNRPGEWLRARTGGSE